MDLQVSRLKLTRARKSYDLFSGELLLSSNYPAIVSFRWLHRLLYRWLFRLILIAFICFYNNAPQAEESQPAAQQEQSQTQDRDQASSQSDRLLSRNENQDETERDSSSEPKGALPAANEGSAQLTSLPAEAMDTLNWRNAMGFGLLAIIITTFKLWVYFANFQSLGVLTNRYSLSLITGTGILSFAFYLFSYQNTIAILPVGVAKTFVEFIQPVVNAIFPLIVSSVTLKPNLLKRTTINLDEQDKKNARLWFYNRIRIHIGTELRNNLDQFARDYDWEIIKRSLNRIITDCLASEIISEEKEQALKNKINSYRKLDNELDDYEEKYYAISTIVKDVSYQKVHAVFLAARSQL